MKIKLGRTQFKVATNDEKISSSLRHKISFEKCLENTWSGMFTFQYHNVPFIFWDFSVPLKLRGEKGKKASRAYCWKLKFQGKNVQPTFLIFRQNIGGKIQLIVGGTIISMDPVYILIALVLYLLKIRFQSFSRREGTAKKYVTADWSLTSFQEKRGLFVFFLWTCG